MEAVALFSFTASEADEISFHKGDIIKVTEMEDDSCWVTAEIQGRRGYVPENYISLLPHPWFAGPVSRLEAEQRLRWQDTGVFLVRESESAPGEFSVSVSYGDRVEHFRVLEGGGQYCIWDESFCSLNRLVDFYRTHSVAVEKVVCFRDPPSSPQLLPHPARNPYPNPYRSSSQESIPSARLHSHPSHPERESSPRRLQPVLEKPRLAHALCDYTPPQSAHLHFLRGDIIDLLDCSSSLSWRGRCRGRVGVFPPDYVQPLYH
ncbi:GRB2-related adapter protein-like isoform X1 [Acanthochromis polyacanthus]|uniref:GRB2-related adapter protein-like isoform X1 n=2 Tax=Acanthochromis polyacanthus TaxID=80966 RepID=UPI000B905B68|nr:GRB2-related adapter protein-like isoform X1 [Acanthochromis polyacanthus]